MRRGTPSLCTAEKENPDHSNPVSTNLPWGSRAARSGGLALCGLRAPPRDGMDTVPVRSPLQGEETQVSLRGLGARHGDREGGRWRGGDRAGTELQLGG